MLSLNLALAGLAVGSIAALSGIGLLITYRATGVFNLAHGGIAMIVAYLIWQFNVGYGWPLWAAAPVAILGVAPAIGMVAERFVFRPLQRRAASPAESLVATIGLLGLLLGIASVVWGFQTRPAPALLPATTWQVGGVILHADALAELGIVLLATGGLALIANHTRLGTRVRAVVDGRELAELSAINADRVSALGWAVGAAFAGLTGALLAPILALNPYNLTLLVLEIFAVPVIARLSSLPVAIAAALALGIGSSELSQVTVGVSAQQFVQALRSNTFVVALLVALLVVRRLREFRTAGDAGSATGFAIRSGRPPGPARRAVEYAVATGFLVLPVAFPVTALRQAQQIPALAVIFVSIVAITGYSGQISLGQAGYAGLGALLFARFSTDTPELVALGCGILAAGAVGLLTGYPAIRRRGLFLALTTFAVAAFVSEFVFNQPYFTSGVLVARPNLFGLHLTGERSFYLFELGCLAVALLVVRNLRSGRLGRALVAMRDSEAGARSVGIDLRVLKVFIFAASAVLAGLGGALLTQTQRAFDPTAFDPLTGLVWFLVVVVFGADSAAGAVLAAVFVVTVDGLANNPQAYFVPVGVLALLAARRPGGLIQAGRDLLARVRGQPAEGSPAGGLPVATVPHGLVLSERGRAALARVRP